MAYGPAATPTSCAVEGNATHTGYGGIGAPGQLSDAATAMRHSMKLT